MFRLAPLSAALVLATAAPAAAVLYEGEVVGVTPDTVAVKTQFGEVKVLKLSKGVDPDKPASRYWNLPHSRIVVGQRISVDAWRNNGVYESLGYRLEP